MTDVKEYSEDVSEKEIDSKHIIKPNTMGVWSWVGTFILVSIPIVNFIFLIIWGFGSNKIPHCKKTFARAYIFIYGILVLLFVAVGVLGLAGLFSIF